MPSGTVVVVVISSLVEISVVSKEELVEGISSVVNTELVSNKVLVIVYSVVVSVRSPVPSETVGVVDKVSAVVETTVVSKVELGSVESVVVSLSFRPDVVVIVEEVLTSTDVLVDSMEVDSDEVLVGFVVDRSHVPLSDRNYACYRSNVF